ncbi:distal tail protein Dit [Eupransor demetentiae]|uniref:Phage-related protein YomH (YomH) n=1 Tax=Eupransor demetentiae TaxID=3109584 RepID=A0ABM9N4M8_9LACO|nr:Phage-related protein YomH (YomH) [Lactobacillaceae bacterium LMG 33000]
MTYEFRDIEKHSSPPKERPIESLTFNGYNLDDEIEEFTTLNVDGRDNYTRKLNVADTFGDGDFFLNSSLDKNVITVKFFLIADDTDKFNLAFTRLKSLLQGDEKTFYFDDEQEFTRTGTVTKLTNTEPGSIGVEGNIEITMSDPYRYGQVKEVSGTNVAYINDPQILYPQNVDTITIKNGTSSVNTLKLTIGNDWSLVLNGSIPANSTIVVDINNRQINQNGTSILNYIDITKTNIFEARIKLGDQVRVSGAKGLNVKYRVKLL